MTTLHLAVLLVPLSMLAACGSGGSSTGPAPGGPDPAPPAMVAGLRCSGPQHTGWCWQAPQPWGHQVRSVVFTSAQDGVAAGDGGLLLRTRDGGLTWAEQWLPDSPPLQALAFADTRTGWLLGRDRGRIWRTDDGGDTWQALPRLPFDRGVALHLAGSQTVVATGTTVANPYASGTAISDDGGRSWRASARAVDQVLPGGSLWARDDTLGALESTDGGRSFAAPRGWAGDWQASWWGLHSRGTVWAAQRPDTVDGLLGGDVSWRQSADGPWARLPAGALASTPLRGLVLTAQGGWAEEDAAAYQATRWWHWAGPGSDWQPVALPDGLQPYMVTRHGWLDADTAWFQAYASGPRPVMLTTDGGRSWQRDIGQPAGTADTVREITRDGGGGLLLNYGPIGGTLNLAPVERWYRSQDGGRSWRALPGAQAPDSPVTGLHFFDDLRGLAFTLHSRWTTTDGGRHWQRQDSTQPNPAAPVMAADGSGWGLLLGRLMRTRDSGQTWTPQALPAGLDQMVERLQWLDDRNGALTARTRCGRHGCALALHITTDGGATWQARPDPEGDVGHVHLRTAEVGVRFSLGTIWRTGDGGRSWQAATLASGEHRLPQRVVVLTDGTWLALSTDRLLRSDDDGRSWRDVPLPQADVVDPAYGGSTPLLRDLAFADAANGWIAGHDGSLLATTDGGRSWVRQLTGTQAHLHVLVARPGGRVWAGGAYATVLATATGGR